MNQSSFLIYRVGISEMQPHQSRNTSIQWQPRGSLHNIVLCKHYLYWQGFRTDDYMAISCFLCSIKEAANFNLHHTEVPWYNEGLRDRQKMFTIARFQYIQESFPYVLLLLGKELIPLFNTIQGQTKVPLFPYIWDTLVYIILTNQPSNQNTLHTQNLIPWIALYVLRMQSMCSFVPRSLFTVAKYTAVKNKMWKSLCTQLNEDKLFYLWIFLS